jgi:branched-chain amino acid transport system substrate-binding protein
MTTRRSFLQTSAATVGVLVSGGWPAHAANAPGVTDTEIKFGQTMFYSGPGSSYGVIGRTEVAYFKMINEMGGVNGRKLNFVSVDDAYSPPKTVEQTRRLVEQEQVAFMFGSPGTANNAAVRAYLNDNKVPQLFVATGSSLWNDPEHFPWTIGLQPSYQTEARIYAKRILQTKPDAKIGVLYQNDGFGKDYLIGLKDGLGPDHAGMVIKEISYELSEPTVDSQIATLHAAGPDTLVIAATNKAAAQAIRKVYDIGWAPLRFVSNVSVSITAVMKPAGLDKSKGLITGIYIKDATDPRWKDDPGMNRWKDFCGKYLSANDFIDYGAAFGFGAAETMVYVLRQCGNDLSRENVLKQATNIKDLELPMLLPGTRINTSPTDYRTIRQLQLATFNGESWEPFGELLSD